MTDLRELDLAVDAARLVDEMERDAKEGTMLCLKDIAARIDAHLKRFEADPAINVKRERRLGGLRPYWNPGAGVCGRYVGVTYIRFQGTRCLPKTDALRYLAWLDAGGVGRHYEALR